jgi:putative DNA primase/helicase
LDIQHLPPPEGRLMNLAPADIASFAKLGIPPDLLLAAHVQRVNDREARDAFGITYSGDKSGIIFPYYIGDRRATARLRRDNPEVDTEGKPQNKYISAWGDHRHLYFPPCFMDTLKRDSEVAIVAVEAEKSALAGTAWAQRTGARLVFFALGGCWGWRGRIGKTESPNGTRVDVKGALPDLAVCDGRRVYILLDSNVATQPKVQAAERAFVAELRKRKCDVFTGRVPILAEVNGPDDLLAVAGDDAMADVIASAKTNDRPIAGDDGGSFVVDTMQVQQQFTDVYGPNLRYTAESGRWSKWTGLRDAHAEACDVFELSRVVCREVSLRPENARSRSWIASPGCVAGIEKLARGRKEHRISVAQWDRDPWMLNTPGGLVHLKTGATRPGRPEDYCSKITAVAPLPGPYRPDSSPLWLKFLNRATQGDRDLENFLQRMAGYCLTGITREHALFFFYGTGGNGKGTFMNAVRGAMGDYATTAAMDTLMATDMVRHPTELAGLQGARMVLMSEPEEGGRWAEAKVKSLTGGDELRARFMRQDFFTFIPQFKPVIAGNHKPGLRTPDVAMRRRMNLILFTAEITPEEKDDMLGDKLRLEWPAILSWMIEGCLEWQRCGLCPPKVVTDATDEYMAGEDKIGRWIGDCCLVDATKWTSTVSLFASFTKWAEDGGEHGGPQYKFAMALETRGFKKERHGYVRGFLGLGVRQ